MLETILIVFVVALVLVGGVAGFVSTRKRRATFLEPGPTRPERARPGAPTPAAPEQAAPGVAPEAPVAKAPRFAERLGRARAVLGARVGAIVARGRIDQSVWDELEEALLLADVGVSTTMALVAKLAAMAKSGEISSPPALGVALRAELVEMLSTGTRELDLGEGAANVWLFVGVNGVGKTTTIGKVAKAQQDQGRRVVMAAGDTFRAAAAEQLGQWAERTGADLVRGAEGSDPGAVIFDAVQKAQARGAQLVLADTAGRLHTKVNLMEELRKVRRVAERPPGQVREVLLVIDATTGQNGLVQARQFAEATGVTGVVLTKLDGSAKGGIAIAIQTELGIPIKLVGLGEGVGDLVPFDPAEFVDALLGQEGGVAEGE